MFIKKESFGTTPTGREVFLFTLGNDKNVTLQITNYGGIVTSLKTPDRRGQLDDVVLGFASLKDYLQTHPYFGALIGRYGNRIANGRFVLNGLAYQFAQNDGPNSLHGGLAGFDKVVWEGTEIQNSKEVGLQLSYLSRDGEEGYPGNLKVVVQYLLNNDNEFTITYEAVTDKPTVLNLTNHSYFNLKGEGSGDILGHEIVIQASKYTAVNDKLIPTGVIRPVAGTPLDFTAPQPIGSRIDQIAGGYDHNYVLDQSGAKPSLAAKVSEPASGRVMEVYTTEPGIQFYTGNFLDGTLTGKAGRTYGKHAGFCLETQHFPDSPNQPGFPTTVLNPGETYRQTTIYKFPADN